VADLAALGREAGRLGIPVTSFGLGSGYAEDLMASLALASDGNHAFIPDEGALARYFDREMGEALSVAARDIVIEITLAEGVRYIGSLDREITVDGRVLRWRLSQLPSGVEKRLLIEVEAPALSEGAEAELASSRASYADASGREQAAISRKLGVTGAAADKVAASLNGPVAADAALAKANLRRDEAIRLKDEGKAAEAGQVLMQNAQELREAQKRTGVGSLAGRAMAYENDAAEMSAPSADWNEQRKSMKARSHSEATQQGY
jgi:Ca-activated chloride channel family protein